MMGHSWSRLHMVSSLRVYLRWLGWSGRWQWCKIHPRGRQAHCRIGAWPLLCLGGFSEGVEHIYFGQTYRGW